MASKDKISQIQKELDETKSIMHKNIEKIIERGDNLENLENGTENLKIQGKSFRTKAMYLKRTMCWKNCRLTLAIISVVLVILIIALILIITSLLSAKK